MEESKVKLGDVIELTTGFPFKSNSYTLETSGIKLLRGDNIGQGRLRWNGVKLWPIGETAAHDFYLLRDGDTVLAMDRPWIEAGLKYAGIRESDLPCLLVQRVARLRGRASIFPGFLRYIIGGQAFTDYILAVQTGTAVPHISSSQIKSFEFHLPALTTQKAITALLLALDDKIELNRRMNETLEAMARTIFKDWFVDFGPTRAKIEGRTPYLAPEIWDLFPDHLNADGIPDGWKMGSIEELFILQRGFDLPSSERKDGTYPIFAASGLNGFHNDHMVCGPGVTTGRSGVIGGVFFVHQDFWPLNTSLWVKTYKASSPTHAYFVLQTLDLSHLNAGSAVPTLNRNHVHLLPFVVSPECVINEFNNITKHLFNRIWTNEKENQTLAQTRDFLLPKLMSGDIRIREAEKMVEAVI